MEIVVYILVAFEVPLTIELLLDDRRHHRSIDRSIRYVQLSFAVHGLLEHEGGTGCDPPSRTAVRLVVVVFVSVSTTSIYSFSMAFLY